MHCVILTGVVILHYFQKCNLGIKIITLSHLIYSIIVFHPEFLGVSDMLSAQIVQMWCFSVL